MKRDSTVGAHYISPNNIQDDSLQQPRIQIKQRKGHLRQLDMPDIFPAILFKGDNRCAFLFTFLHTNLLLERSKL